MNFDDNTTAYFDYESARKALHNNLSSVLADFHSHPELSFQEARTTGRIKELLDNYGIEQVDIGAETGVVAVIRSNSSNLPPIALRADIDAIPQNELSDRPDISLAPGIMHGCGHDIHTAALLGAALLLLQVRDRLQSDVYLIFQPAEEKLAGASYLINECKLFEHISPSMIFGLHNYPESAVGTVCIKEGALMSWKDSFSVKYIGKAAHSSMPQKNIDPIVAIASFVQSIQTIVSRNVGPFENAVISVYQLHAGDEKSITVSEAYASGNIRTLDSDVRKRILKRMQEIAEYTAKVYSCECEYCCSPIVPGVVNSPRMTEIARKAAKACVGAEHIVTPPPNMASEDFSLYGEQIPSFFYFLGSGAPERPLYSWHSPHFHPTEETYLYGAALLANSVLCSYES